MKTYSKQFNEAIACNTQAEADAWIKMEIERYKSLPDFKGDEAEAVRVIKVNLGYMAGYYGSAEAEKINRLFGAVHPVFGTSTYHKDVPPEAAHEAGQALATAAK